MMVFLVIIFSIRSMINPIGTSVSKDQEGGHIVPPLNIFGLGRVRVPILFGNDLPRSDLPYEALTANSK